MSWQAAGHVRSNIDCTTERTPQELSCVSFTLNIRVDLESGDVNHAEVRTLFLLRTLAESYFLPLQCGFMTVVIVLFNSLLVNLS